MTDFDRQLDDSYERGYQHGRRVYEFERQGLRAERDMLRAQIDHIMKHLSELDAMKLPAPFLVVINEEKNGAIR